jgi:hypothetical protein
MPDQMFIVLFTPYYYGDETDKRLLAGAFYTLENARAYLQAKPDVEMFPHGSWIDASIPDGNFVIEPVELFK